MADIPVGAALIAALVLLAVSGALGVLYWRERRNVRLLSRELDEADRTMADQTARLQVAHDLHQSAAVTLAGLVTQADAARYLAASDPAAVERSTTQIADAARLALADLRRTATIAGGPITGALSTPGSAQQPITQRGAEEPARLESARFESTDRAELIGGSSSIAEPGRGTGGAAADGEDPGTNAGTDAATSADTDAATSADADTDSVEELLHRMRAAGLVITLTENGERFELTHAAQTAVLRIVEEALANALKHGGDGTEVSVGVTWSDAGLQLTVDDDGQTVARRPELAVDREVRDSIADDAHALTTVVAGRGISAMRERATAFGGVMTASKVSGVGFSVSVVFPSLRYDNGVHGVNLQR